jgi:AcrR family transcriptional regulator
MTTLSAKGTRLNRRGLETRANVLRVAIRVLADGGHDAVSANLVAREAGVTWGTVQHQFGDTDGLWAALLVHISERGGPLLPLPSNVPSIAVRVELIVETMWDAFDKPTLRAIHNLRQALPRERSELEADFPKTAAALMEWDAAWERACRGAFRGAGIDRVRMRRVRALLPGAVRGLYVEQHLGSYADVDDARRGLVDAITAYLN